MDMTLAAFALPMLPREMSHACVRFPHQPHLVAA